MKAREIILDDRFDVIVTGGGPAGCAAAIAAAREGARTLLLEATGALGGMGTMGLVPAWCPFSDQEKIIYKGLAETVFTRSKAGMPHVNPQALDWVPIDPEHLKRVYDDLVTAAGVTVLFNALVTGAEMKAAGQVDVVLAASKAGLTAYRAAVFVDCSGDADVAAYAGADFEKGDAEHDLQPATHCFVLGNVDEYSYRHDAPLHGSNRKSIIFDIAASDEFPLIVDWHICNSLVGPRTVGFNAGHIWGVDNTKPETVSAALIHGRKIAAQFREALAKRAPKAFANAHLAATAPLMGIRETRRIIGDYYLVADDLRNMRSFADEIGRNCYYVDVHGKRQDANKTEPGAEHFCFPPGKSHGIPYRCLTPKGLKNVLVAGRCISTDRAAQGSTRVMPVCLVTGEAAGLAAALAAKAGGDIRGFAVSELQARLTQHGAYLQPASAECG
jgi:hypothetical protein